MTLAAGVAGFDQAQARMRRSHPDQLLAITLCVSVAAHLGLLLLAPMVQDAERPAPLPLEVALVRPPAPQPPQAAPPPSSAIRQPPPVARPAPRASQAVRPVPEPHPKARASEPSQAAPSRPSSVTLPRAPAVSPASPSPPAAPLPAEATAGVPAREPSLAAPPGIAVTPSVPAPSQAIPAPVTVPPSFNAAYLRNAPPGYPMAARRSGVEGTVRLKVRVTREGRAAQVQLEQTSGSRALDTAALDAVKTWQFVPARRGEETIESWVLVPVVFKLEGAI